VKKLLKWSDSICQSYAQMKKGTVFEDIFIRFDMIHERDWQTDRQTSHDGIDRAYA